MKGLASKTIGELIVMVIVVIILGAASVSALPYIKNLLAQYFGLTVDNAFTEAVDCSYLRCVNGCSDPKVQSNGPGSPWTKIGNACPCANVPSELKDNYGGSPNTGTICGWKGAQYPVETTPDTSQALTTTSFPDNSVDCVLRWDVDSLSGPFETVKSVGSWLFISKDLLNSNNEPVDCTALAGKTLQNFIPSVSKTFYIWTDNLNCGLPPFNAPNKKCYYTYVSSSPFYYLLTPNPNAGVMNGVVIQFQKPYQILGITIIPASQPFVVIRVTDVSSQPAVYGAGSIQFYVENSNLALIQGATVSASGPTSGTCTTDSNGQCMINNLAAGNSYTVTASANNYQSKTESGVSVGTDITTIHFFVLSSGSSSTTTTTTTPAPSHIDKRFLASSDGKDITITEPTSGSSKTFSFTNCNDNTEAQGSVGINPTIEFIVKCTADYQFTVFYAGVTSAPSTTPVQFAKIKADITASGIVELQGDVVQGDVVTQNNQPISSTQGQVVAVQGTYFYINKIESFSFNNKQLPLDNNGHFKAYLEYPGPHPTTKPCSVVLTFRGDNTYSPIPYQSINLPGRDSRCS